MAVYLYPLSSPPKCVSQRICRLILRRSLLVSGPDHIVTSKVVTYPRVIIEMSFLEVRYGDYFILQKSGNTVWTMEVGEGRTVWPRCAYTSGPSLSTTELATV